MVAGPGELEIESSSAARPEGAVRRPMTKVSLQQRCTLSYISKLTDGGPTRLSNFRPNASLPKPLPQAQGVCSSRGEHVRSAGWTRFQLARARYL